MPQVCKAWDHLISTPKFSTLAFQNARTGLGYIVARVAVEIRGIGPKFHGWVILDLEARRWYRITHEYTKLDKDDRPQVPVYSRTYDGHVRTDGGLVCEFVSWSGSEGVMSIYNTLMRRRVIRLPDMPDRGVAGSALRLMDIISHDDDDNFSVFWISTCIKGDEGGEYHFMRVYESRTGRWRSATNPPLPPEVKVGQPGIRVRIRYVVFQGLLYVLFEAERAWLCRYNVVQDLWEDTGAGVPFQDVQVSYQYSSPPQLIVSDNRLFYLCRVNADPDSIFCAYEVLLADRSLRVVFQMTDAQLRLQFGFRSSGVISDSRTHFVQRIFNTEEMDDNQESWCPKWIEAFGFGKSLLLMSVETGIPIVYKLVSRSWDRMPSNSMLPLPEGCEFWYAETKAINLRLPSRDREESMQEAEEKNKSTSALGGSGKAAPSQNDC